MKPPKSILDRSFQYTPSAQTDVRKTFRRIQREQRANDAERIEKVKQLSPGRARKA
jgi:hypothetical protein